MFDPNELKEITFKKNLGGSYNAAEVDDFLAQLTDDYKKIYTDNAELQVKLELMAQRLAGYKKEEQKIKTAVANVRLLCDNLINEANEKSKKIIQAAVTERDSIVSALEDTIKQKRGEIEIINASVAEYKEKMLTKYKLHYDSINELPLFDMMSSEQLIEKTQQRFAALKEQEEEIPVLLDEKEEPAEDEVAEFIEPTEKPAAPVISQRQQEIKARVIQRVNEQSDTVVFDKVEMTPTSPTSSPTVVFDKPVAQQVPAEEEEIPEGQTNFEDIQEEVTEEEAKETQKEEIAEASDQKAYNEDVFASFAPKEKPAVKEEAKAEEEKEPISSDKKTEDDDIDAPEFLKNRRRRGQAAPATDKQTLIDNIKSALAEKERQERERWEAEEQQQKEIEDIGTSANPIDDDEDEEIIPDFKDDIRFGRDYEEDDDEDDDDEDEDDGDSFFSFFRSR